MSSSALELYRRRVPGHFAVPDDVVSDALEDAASSLSATAFGIQYALACVWWAAARIDPDVQAGAYPVDGSCEPPEPVDPKKLPPPLDYWARFERIRDSRAASGPFVVGSC
jgi:hypothetical protein